MLCLLISQDCSYFQLLEQKGHLFGNTAFIVVITIEFIALVTPGRPSTDVILVPAMLVISWSVVCVQKTHV